ncbi:MAG: glycosyltransferase family 1 protein [Acidobacteria bacterium]|nr:MAG: glycosyltransferase family 1 protein [Acidobacteriota bacterium]
MGAGPRPVLRLHLRIPERHPPARVRRLGDPVRPRAAGPAHLQVQRRRLPPLRGGRRAGARGRPARRPSHHAHGRRAGGELPGPVADADPLRRRLRTPERHPRSRGRPRVPAGRPQAVLTAPLFPLLDARPLQGPTASRGVGAYVRELLGGLARAEPEWRIGVLVGSGSGLEPLPGDGGGRFETIVAWKPPGPAVVWGRLLGPRWLLGSGAELFHATFLAPPRVPRRIPWVATVHDLIPLRHPKLFPWRNRVVFSLSLAAAARADVVLAVSEFTARALRERFEVPARRIRVVPAPVDAALFGPPGEVRTGPPYLLHLGGFDPLKGVTRRLLPAFALVARRRPDVLLVMTGGPGPGRAAAARAARELGVARSVRFAGVVSREERRRLLRGASAVVVASDEEGFGLPAAEALACGLPVAVGPAEATREVVGDAGFPAEGPEPEALARAIEAALDAPGPRTEQGRARVARARRFEPEAVAREVAEVYRGLAGRAGA